MKRLIRRSVAWVCYAAIGVDLMMSASQEIGTVLGIDAEARRLERERVLGLFADLAKQMDEKADEDDGYIGLVWTAAAACIRRVCDEASA